jgi:LPXTG-site transpeptidase (sortase) family protein
MTAVHMTVRLVRAVQNAWSQKWRFFFVFLTAFYLSFSVLLALDFVPDGKNAEASDTPLVTLSSAPLSPNVADAFATSAEKPVKIEIPSISLSATIANPETTDVEKLDQYLLKGAVRYPTSALLGEKDGNVILFGHSSYLPIVNNLAYKTFDGIQKLHAGDSITVYSSDRAYTYSVDTVTKEDSTSTALPLSVTGAHLTLSTCDSFAEKTDRFVVTAHLVSSAAL